MTCEDWWITTFNPSRIRYLTLTANVGHWNCCFKSLQTMSLQDVEWTIIHMLPTKEGVQNVSAMRFHTTNRNESKSTKSRIGATGRHPTCKSCFNVSGETPGRLGNLAVSGLWMQKQAASVELAAASPSCSRFITEKKKTAIAILDLGTDSLVVDAIPCQDGHAQERSLFQEVLHRCKPSRSGIADRTCTAGSLFNLERSCHSSNNENLRIHADEGN